MYVFNNTDNRIYNEEMWSGTQTIDCLDEFQWPKLKLIITTNNFSNNIMSYCIQNFPNNTVSYRTLWSINLSINQISTFRHFDFSTFGSMFNSQLVILWDWYYLIFSLKKYSREVQKYGFKYRILELSVAFWYSQEPKNSTRTIYQWSLDIERLIE